MFNSIILIVLFLSVQIFGDEYDGPYNGDDSFVNTPYITCWEQNKYTYAGYQFSYNKN